MERKNAVTMKGAPLTLMGDELVPGMKAPDFRVLDQKLDEVTVSAFKEKILVIASVPSLDTPVCDLQIKRFNDEAAGLSKDVKVVFISMDLPFAQKRFCQEFNIKKVTALSDHRFAEFGREYGVLIKELRLLARAVFVVDGEGILRYSQYVKEIGDQPDYDAVLKVVRELLG